MPVWFEYAPRGTWLHRMNPISKMAMFIFLLVTISFIWEPRYLALYAIAAAVLYITSKTPGKWMILGIPFGLYRFIEATIYSFTLAKPELYKVIPYELAAKPLFQIGPVTMIYGSFLFAVAYIFRIIVVMAITFTFIYTTSLNELIKSLPKLKIPSQIIFIVVIALKFVPELWREFSLTSKAQSLRGWQLKTKNPVKLFKMSAPIVNPFTRKMITYVDRLTLTVQIRGFGTKSVKYPWKIKFGIVDWIVTILSLIATVYVLYLVFVFNFGQL